jgi:hypothetical protein
MSETQKAIDQSDLLWQQGYEAGLAAAEARVERRFSDELGFTDFADGIGPVYATADQMIVQIRREREQSEEYWAEIERLRKVVDSVRGVRNATDNKHFHRAMRALAEQMRELEESDV